MNIVQRVRYSRNCTNDSFPLPSVVDCLWYAYTESGEAIDARLRAAQPEHLRNNHRNTDMRKEVGQTIYMLCSAWTQMHRGDIFKVWPAGCGASTLDLALVEACDHTIGAITDMLCGDENGLNVLLALQAWCNVCTVAGWNVDDLIEDVCCDFERKHCVTKVVLP